MLKKILFLFLITSFLGITAQTTHTVNSETSFNNALSIANADDIIVWENGTYADVFMNIEIDEITITAETSGGVTFNGSTRVEIVGDNVTFNGFQFVGVNIVTGSTSEVDNTIITIDGSYATVSNINFEANTSWKYLRIREDSQYSEVTHCNFENRLNYADKNIVQVDINENQPGYHNINYCSFKNFAEETTGGDDGVEPIRIGSSGMASYVSKTTVEYCYFTQCNGDGEIISHKGTECMYRYNTFDGNPKSELVLRHGDKGIVYGNFFTNSSGGIRVQEGSDHLIFNNYFSGLTNRSLNLNASDSDRLDNILIAYNTFVDSAPVDIENDALNEATNITIANNIFSDPSTGDGLFDDLTDNETWIGNVAFGTLGDGSISDFTIEDPELSLNTEGYYVLGTLSPVIDSGTAGYPTLPLFTDLSYDNQILLDVLGSTRPASDAMKDIGCQEYDASATLEPQATATNTGPDYIIDPDILSTTNEEIIAKSFNLYSNPIVDNTIRFNFSLTQTAAVKVAIHDLSGKKIKTLINRPYASGNQNFSSQLDLSSGVYLLYVEVSYGNIFASKVTKIVKQ